MSAFCCYPCRVDDGKVNAALIAVRHASRLVERYPDKAKYRTALDAAKEQLAETRRLRGQSCDRKASA